MQQIFFLLSILLYRICAEQVHAFVGDFYGSKKINEVHTCTNEWMLINQLIISQLMFSDPFHSDIYFSYFIIIDVLKAIKFYFWWGLLYNLKVFGITVLEDREKYLKTVKRDEILCRHNRWIEVLKLW